MTSPCIALIGLLLIAQPAPETPTEPGCPIDVVDGAIVRVCAGQPAPFNGWLLDRLAAQRATGAGLALEATPVPPPRERPGTVPAWAFYTALGGGAAAVAAAVIVGALAGAGAL